MNANTPQKTEAISSLYVLKALCAFGVVILHAPAGLMTDSLRLLASIAVPIFFIITGYFLFTEDKEKLNQRLQGSIKKVFIVTLITNVAMTLISLGQLPAPNQIVLWLKWLFLGQHYTYAHLWYLTALLEALILLWGLNKLGLKRHIPLLCFFWLAKFALEDYSIYTLGKPSSMFAANALFYAIPCVAIGWTIRKYQASLMKLPYLELALGLSVIFIFAVRFALPQGEVLQVILTPFARTALMITTFLCAIRHSNRGSGSTLEYIGHKLSGNIYYWHGAFITLFVALLPSQVYDNWGAVCVAITSLVFAQGIASLQQRLGVNYLP